MRSAQLNTARRYTACVSGLVAITAMFVTAFLVSGCASQPQTPTTLTPLRGYQPPHIADADFGTVTPEMEAFLDRYVTQGHGAEKAAWTLVWAMTDPGVNGFRYDPLLTQTPAETFSSGAGNCLSFSALFMLMARHIGLNAWYQEVQVPPQWNSANSTLLVSMHINVLVEGRRGAWVVDVSGRETARSQQLRILEDHEVLAQYYNNLGAEALTTEDLATAYAYFRKAIQTSPRLSYLWSNLGVVYNRNLQLDDAMQAHRVALELDPGNTMAANNLYLIYEEFGYLEEAAALHKQVEKHRRKNPYYLYYLSSVAREEGRTVESLEMLQRAVQMHDREYRFHYELARLEALHGNQRAAVASLQRALELAPPDALAGVTPGQVNDLPELPE